MSENSLSIFDQLTMDWFTKSLGKPTPVQDEAWPAIAAGEHTLVSAPTGTGKTLSAFLFFIDRLMLQAREGTLKQELQLIYVSPLKSLAGDIRENLRRPMEGIAEEERKAGIYPIRESSMSPTKSDAIELTVAIRTGDTPQSERRRMIKKPPHILITTPESLYLMLTSMSGQKIIKTARAIIIDELHALIDSKRGAHLMLSIARLDRLCTQPLQRIGLSATIEPLSKAAEYLSPDSVTIVAPKMQKKIQLAVTSPMSDTNIIMKDPIWQELAKTVYTRCIGTHSAIAFLEARAYAEKLAYFINELGGEGFARTHHGSLSKEQRFDVENALRNGSLRLLCATSSMELGIDVGDIDQVFQIGCPRTISSTMQRLGRAGHNPNGTSIMHMFPRESVEGLYCGMTAEVARNGGVEYSHPPRLCLDILAQHLISMATGDGYSLGEVMEILPRAYPFREVTLQDVRDVLAMLAGDYEHERDIPVRPRVLYDRIHDRVEGDPYSRMLAVSAGGTIPDKGLYAAKTESGVKLGELDEEFIFETRIGDRFLLGTFAWQIVNIQKDNVIVKPASTAGARLPFWHGDMKGRRLQTGLAFGSIFHKLGIAYEEGTLYEELSKLGLDDMAAKNAMGYLERQIKATGVLPDDRTIIVEHFLDETGNNQMMIHSIFGRQVNEPLSILAREIVSKHMQTAINSVDLDDGFLLFPYDGQPLPEGILQEIEPTTARNILASILPSTPLFNMNFRYNSARALMMGVRNNKRQPLWIQRMRSAEMLASLLKYDNHPLIRETKRECLEDFWDLPGVEYILNSIRSGDITVFEIYPETPSPMSLPLRRQTEASQMYDYSPTPMSIHQATAEALKQAQMITPAPEQLAQVSERNRLPEDDKQLHSLLMMEGDLIAGELDVPVEWLDTLARRDQARYIEPGLWIATEHNTEYHAALIEEDTEARLRIVRRALRYRGAQTAETLGERYFWPEDTALKILKELCNLENAVEYEGLYYHAELYDRARHETVKFRRKQIKTLTASRYAALLANRTQMNAPSGEQLEKALHILADQTFSPVLWESVLLPARVNNYRPELLDTLLANGSLFWHLDAREGLSFHRYEDIDWETDLSIVLETLADKEKMIYDALLKRGASFMQRLTDLLNGASPYDTLQGLAEKGLVCADSFMPIRQWQNSSKLQKRTLRQRINVRSKALSTGRWEVSRPLIPLTIEQQLERIFDRVIILSRETIQGLSWITALETLRIWEYTGRVRRGYFIEGLSGIQFIRDKDFAGTMLSLEKPRDQIIWLNAVDPAQQWGKSLPHMQNREFINVAGTVVALRAGIPIAIFERQGKILRVFEENALAEALEIFSKDYSKKKLFTSLNRIIVKEYPPEAATAFRSAGFFHEIQDFVLYRGYQ